MNTTIRHKRTWSHTERILLRIASIAAALGLIAALVIYGIMYFSDTRENWVYGSIFGLLAGITVTAGPVIYAARNSRYSKADREVKEWLRHNPPPPKTVR